MLKLSVIIPTRNRAKYLKIALESVLDQTLCSDEYEIIVIDNGSSDNTKEVVDSLNGVYEKRIKYFYEELPGLHNGRHRGIKEARAKILTFADDDIIATSEWLESINESFASTDVVLVGGKVLPKWETSPPDWISKFWEHDERGKWLGHLSLLDFGDKKIEISPYFVYGCNFSIRRDILKQCGGFHPDGMPQELIRYRGDGETAVSRKVLDCGYNAIYAPKAKIYHLVPTARMTLEYFCRRSYNQGISNSFTEIRQKHGMDGAEENIPDNTPQSSLLNKIYGQAKHIVNVLSEIRHCLNSHNREYLKVKKAAEKSYEEGRIFHQGEVNKNPTLLKYVLRENFMGKNGKTD